MSPSSNDTPPVRISPLAQEAILDTLRANKIPDTYGLRVGIKGGGCSGTFLLGFDTPTVHDDQYTIEGIRVLIDRRHLMYVLGVNVDYTEGPEESGFTVGADR